MVVVYAVIASKHQGNPENKRDDTYKIYFNDGVRGPR
jgi:hypothetical protein